MIKIYLTTKKLSQIQKENKELIEKIKYEIKIKLYKLNGKEFIKSFINYLETILIKGKYKNIEQILLALDFNKDEINEINNIIYKDYSLNIEILVENIKIRFS